MNRERIEAGRNWQKYGECFVIGGGLGAIIYPLVYYFVAGVTVLSRDAFLKCVIESELAAQNAGKEKPTNSIRSAMFMGQVVMAAYLTVYFFLFAGVNMSRSYSTLSVVFSIILVAGVIVPIVMYSLIGISECNTETYGTAAAVSATAILIVSIGVSVVSLMLFCSKTRTNNSQVAIDNTEKRQLVNQSDQTQSDANVNNNN